MLLIGAKLKNCPATVAHVTIGAKGIKDDVGLMSLLLPVKDLKPSEGDLNAAAIVVTSVADIVQSPLLKLLGLFGDKAVFVEHSITTKQISCNHWTFF